jgi:L-fuconolactonase
MLKIDSHQHYWLYHPVKDAWITDELKVIQKDFLPVDVWPVMQQNGVSGCVAVQADQSENENDFLLGLAQKYSFIKGIVGWVNLQADNIEEHLAYYSEIKLIKGFRHILQGEPDDAYMLNEKFIRGISLLNKYHFTYDLLIKPQHLSYAAQLVSKFPEQRFVIDHVAKPFIKDKLLDGWREGIRAIAAHSNVYCKISGLITEADWTNQEPEGFTPYLDVVFNTFGINRVMFGSDWPVCNLASGYDGALNAIKYYVSQLTLQEQELFWGQNAIGFYRLEV